MSSLRRLVAESAGGLPRAFWVLFLGTLINRATGFVVPFLALYLADGRGFSPSFVGLVIGVIGGGSTIGVLVGGVLADRWGRRPTLFVCQLATAVSMVGLGLSHAVLPILVWSVMLGLASNAVRPAFTAMMIDVVPERDQLRAISLNYWAINLGFSFTALIGGLVVGVGYLLAFAADAATVLITATLVFVLVAETRPTPVPPPVEPVSPAPPDAATPAGTVPAPTTVPKPAGLLAVLSDRAFLVFTLLTLATSVLYMQHMSTLPVAMRQDGLTPGTFGAVLAINGVVIVAGQLFVATVIGKRSTATVLAVSAVLLGAGFGLPALGGTLWVYALSVFIWTLGEMASSPATTAVVAGLSPVELRGRYQGVFSLAWAVAALIGPVAGGWVLEVYGSTVLWSGCLVIGVLAAVGHLAFAPVQERRIAQVREAAATTAPAEGMSGG